MQASGSWVLYSRKDCANTSFHSQQEPIVDALSLRKLHGHPRPKQLACRLSVALFPIQVPEFPRRLVQLLYYFKCGPRVVNPIMLHWRQKSRYNHVRISISRYPGVQILQSMCFQLLAVMNSLQHRFMKGRWL
jgi:hypothetical protein